MIPFGNSLRKLQKKIEISMQNKNGLNVEKQCSYLNQFPKPRNNEERSFFQYKCQMKLLGFPLNFIYNISSLPACIVYLFKSLKENEEFDIEKCDAVFYMNDMNENLIPTGIKNSFKKIITKPISGICLSKDDLNFIFKIIKIHPLSWFYIFKIAVKVSMYSFLMKKYKPKAILCFSEYSFTSSILTEYCHLNGVEHINMMHGEKLLSIRDSFFQFDRCYIWDKHYYEIFTSLKAESSQFIIDKPPCLFFDDFNYDMNSAEYDYIYYLQAETERELRVIHELLISLKNKGFVVGVRPHPSHLTEQVIQIFCDIYFEDPKIVPIKESLLNTKHAVSVYSTVLYQALCNNVPIVIDDISNPDMFLSLEKMKFICMNKDYEKLSKII